MSVWSHLLNRRPAHCCLSQIGSINGARLNASTKVRLFLGETHHPRQRLARSHLGLRNTFWAVLGLNPSPLALGAAMINDLKRPTRLGLSLCEWFFEIILGENEQHGRCIQLSPWLAATRSKAACQSA